MDVLRVTLDVMKVAAALVWLMVAASLALLTAQMKTLPQVVLIAVLLVTGSLPTNKATRILFGIVSTMMAAWLGYVVAYMLATALDPPIVDGHPAMPIGAVFVFGAIELILFAWVFGIDRGWAEIQKGADIRIPRIFRFLLGWITPLVMIGIFLAWTWQNAPDVILMRGVDAANAPFVLGARLFMLAAFGVLLYLIRRAWRDHERHP